MKGISSIDQNRRTDAMDTNFSPASEQDDRAISIDTTGNGHGFKELFDTAESCAAAAARDHGPHCRQDQRQCPDPLRCPELANANGEVDRKTVKLVDEGPFFTDLVGGPADENVKAWEREQRELSRVEPQAEPEPVVAGICAEPGCDQPVTRGRSGPPSKFCDEHKSDKGRKKRQRRSQRTSVWEREKQERMQNGKRTIALFEAKMRGEIPPPHTAKEISGDCEWCHGPCDWHRSVTNPTWPIGQENELTAEEQEYLLVARMQAEGQSHRPGCPAPEANCCGPIESVGPAKPQRCRTCGHELTKNEVRFGWCLVCQNRKGQEFEAVIAAARG